MDFGDAARGSVFFHPSGSGAVHPALLGGSDRSHGTFEEWRDHGVHPDARGARACDRPIGARRRGPAIVRISTDAVFALASRLRSLGTTFGPTGSLPSGRFIFLPCCLRTRGAS